MAKEEEITLKSMVGNRYAIRKDEGELLQIEKDLAAYLGVPYVKCSYDAVNSHNYKDKSEIAHRKRVAKESGLWNMCDFIINYEKYETKRQYRNTKILFCLGLVEVRHMP